MPDASYLQKRSVISQDNRLIKLDTPLGPDILLPQRVIAHEKLGRTYRYTVDCLSLERDIELKKLIAQPVTLWVQQTDRGYLPVHGYVHTIKKLGSDGQFIACQITFAPWLDFLKFRQDARIWQDKSADDILTDVFNAHPQARGNFRFRLNNAGQPTAQRSYCVQYETDWNFVHRLMEEEGWFGYHEQKEDGTAHTLIITDNAQALPALASQEIYFHSGGTGDEVDKIVQWGGTRTLSSNLLTTQTFDYKEPAYPQDKNKRIYPEHGADTTAALEVYEYTGPYTHSDDPQGERQADIRVEGWESLIKRFHGIAGNRSMPVGHFFSLEDHPAHRGDPAEDREFIVIEVEWFIENNLPLSNIGKDFPGSLKGELDAFKEQMGVPPQTGAERTGHCFNRFEVQRRKVPFRSALEHKKPVMHAQTATVVGPGNQEIYTDKLNRIKIKFHWDRINPGDQMASTWVRVSFPNAGDDWGTMHVPRIGQEVIIMFLCGNIDRPVVTGRLHNNHQSPHWHSDGMLSGTKTKEVGGSGFNQLVFDDNTSQNRIHLYSTNTHAQLNFGYLVNQHGNQRQAFYGSGFALNTDAYGAIVTNKGLYISTFGRPGAKGTQLDVREAHQQLEAGLNLTKTLSDNAGKANAEALAGQDALGKFADATQDKYSGSGQELANRFKEPVLLAASPAGIGLTTPKGAHIHTGEDVTLSSGQDTNLAVGKSLVASVMEKISFFANKAGIKLFAAKGKIEIQAQSDDLDIIAEKVLRLLSTTGRINIAAKTEILLSAGGSYFKINAAGITSGTQGTWLQHASMHEFVGPDKADYVMPVLPSAQNTWVKMHAQHDDAWDTPWPLTQTTFDVGDETIHKSVSITPAKPSGK
ncbi:type VI secretion system secreted protein VgrG [Oxalobacteraceae bacterium GrIS 1.11]